MSITCLIVCRNGGFKVAGAGDQCRELDVGRQWENSDGGAPGAIVC